MTQPASGRNLDRLAPFVPSIVSQHLRRDPALLSAPELTASAGAILFADLSGFTALTETFAQRGPEGAESVRELLNAHFDPLIKLIAGCGGDVVQFAGDATIAWFPADDSGDAALDGAGRRAVACARQIQTRFDTIGSGGMPLKLRIGIGAGPATVAFLGGADGQWEAVLAGDALSRATTALRQAGGGDVVLSPEVAALPGAGETVAAPPARVDPLPDRAEPAVRSFIPRSLLTRLDAGQTEWLAEFRRVSTMFVGVHGVEFSGARALDRLQLLTQTLQAAVFGHDGTTAQFLVDDKGTTLLAVWGLSLQAHEDDAVRAVRAAMQVRDELGRLGWSCGIGITTGRAFAGVRGNEIRRDYGVIGDVVNLAARLMEAAGTRIYCDAPTRTAARQRVVFEALEPIAVKGRTAPVAVYHPLREKRRLGRDQREMIGRARERDVLTDAFRRVSSGASNEIVILEGEPGIGKSRIVADLTERVAVSTLRAVSAGGDALERSAPLHPWRAVFAGAVGFDGVDRAAGRARLAALLESEPALGPFAPLINDVVPLGVPDTAATGTLTAEGRANRTRELLVYLFRQIARTGAVLVLEDAQWFDSASWSLAETLARQVQPLLLVIVTRPAIDAELPEEARRLFDHPAAQRLKLSALDADEIVALACQRLDVDALPEIVARLIRDRSEGHPFFAGELVATLRDRGLVRVEEGECRLAVDPRDLEAQRLPTTVEGIVSGRIDRLAAPQQITLKLASVFGRTFSKAALIDVHPIAADKPAVDAQLEEMVRVDLIEPDTDASDPGYRFKHAIIEQVAYELLPFAQRRQLHRAVAERYEREQAGALDAIVPLLAHHWSKAEDRPKAISYLEKAGQQALERDNNQEAVRFYGEMLAFDTTGVPDVTAVRRAGWHTRLGEAHFYLAHLPQAVEQFERALAMLGVGLPASKGGEVWFTARHVAAQLAHLARGSRPRAAAVESARIAAAAASLLAWIQMVRHDGGRLAQMSLLSVNLAERAGTTSVFARGMLGLMASSLGIRGLGRRYFDRAREEGYRTNAVRELSVAVLFDAMDLLGAGDQTRSLAVLDEGLRLARGGQSRLCMARIVSVIGLVHGFAGRMIEASRYGQESVDLLPEGPCHDRYHVTISALSIQVMRRSGSEGIALLEASEPALRSLMQPDDIVAVTSLGAIRTMALLRAGRLDDARRDADGLFVVLRRAFSTTLSIQWMMFWALGAAYVASWEAARASHGSDTHALAQRTRAFARLLGRFARKNPVYQPRALIVDGQIDALSGRADRAQHKWQRAAEAARALGLLADEGLARYELGRARPAGSPERRDQLQQARTLFASGGMRHEIDMVDAALRS